MRNMKFKTLIFEMQFPAFFPELDFTTLLVMAANIRDVSIDFTCTSIHGMDLCILWKVLQTYC